VRKRIAVLALVGCAAWAAGASPPPGSGQASAAQVEAEANRLVEAWEKEDLEAAVSGFTADAVVIDPVPPGIFERAEGVRTWVSGSFEALEQIDIDLSQLRIQTSGPVAWLTAHFVFAAQQAGKPFRVEGYVSMVWVVQPDGAYKISVFHASHLPPPPPGTTPAGGAAAQ
jgi:ketosteroid isomerase-like protein